jgi:hypothetical protein
MDSLYVKRIDIKDLMNYVYIIRVDNGENTTKFFGLDLSPNKMGPDQSRSPTVQDLTALIVSRLHRGTHL